MTAQGAVGFMTGTLRGRDTCGGWVVGLWCWLEMCVVEACAASVISSRNGTRKGERLALLETAESDRSQFMKIFPSCACCLFALVASVLSLASAQEMRTIEGQVFIRTEGAETFKLSLVDVLVFEKKVLEENLQKKREIAKPLYEYLEPFAKQVGEEYVRADKAVKAAIGRGDGSFNKALDARSKIADVKRGLRWAADYTMSADYYFSGLPQPLQTTKTDADGKFSFKVPGGSYVLAAFSSRKVGKDTESYHWMLKVTADADKKVMFANDNLCSNDSADSVIIALDHYCGDATKGGIQFVEAFVEQHKQERRAAATAEAKKMEAAAAAATVGAAAAEVAKKEMDRQFDLEVFRKNPNAAQHKAVELYPEVGVAGSPLNKEFLGRMTRYQKENKGFFTEPDWPVRLAKECSEALAAKPVTK